ncbi:rhomboid family intramembrane serine protease [Micromonospora sp. DR5-3]|uniref:rhomboid family intramembrane serine protease n=1 Tax=unclassified Micromonospora TaxID=2617518 RepID=UPI0011DB07EE|nr:MULTISPECIES: rhomboid family intramembrane serine protease [unclassified Micromonospora]MCW3819187.1 rhomboid family intramembrane serine protease [Micromonospora sp. DR5-3]TYC21069.1 rhomboid family intramembrane serine protease [Micromonospora sp. MP36]
MDTISTGQPSGEEATATCYRHPKRETLLSCTRCDRPICPDCMREAPVGHRCPECVRDENRTVRQARTVFGGRVTARTVVTYVLIALNVLAYLAELVHPAILDQFGSLGTGLVDDAGQRYVDDGGAYDGYQLIGIAHGEWYRLITSAFLHLLPTQGILGILHIVFNLYWLWVLGRVIEERLGPVRFLAVYLLSALGGSVLGFLVTPHQAAVGASGAIYGLAGCYFVLTRRLHHRPIDPNRVIIPFLIWMVFSAGWTSWEGHLGGLLAGGAAAVGLAYAPAKRRTLVQTAVLVGLTLLLLVLVAAKSLDLAG